MASLSYKPSQQYVELLNRLGSDEQVYKNAVQAAGKPLANKLKQALATYSKELPGTVKSRVKKNKNDGSYFVVARPYGTRVRGKKTIRNMEIFAFNEFGTSKTGPRPVIDKVQREAETEAIPEMENAITQRVKELGLG